jgi:hypothetical protein
VNFRGYVARWKAEIMVNLVVFLNFAKVWIIFEFFFEKNENLCYIGKKFVFAN